jgi:hypothetical protein
MPRFVILEHDYPSLHWDLMLETGNVLRTWRLANPPQPGKEVAAVYLAEHRRMYLDYEGPVSGDRGRVVRWDAGTYSIIENVDNLVSFLLEGGRVRGLAELTRRDESEWTFLLQP